MYSRSLATAFWTAGPWAGNSVRGRRAASRAREPR